MKMSKYINNIGILALILIVLGICIIKFFSNNKEAYENKDEIIPPLSATAKSNIANIYTDENKHRIYDSAMDIKIEFAKGGFRDLLGKVKSAIDIKYFTDESNKIKDLIKNATNDKDKYNYIQLLLDFYNNKETGWYYIFKHEYDILQVSINVFLEIGSKTFFDMADKLMVQVTKYDIIIINIENETINLQIEAERLEEIFKREAAKRRSNYLEKLNAEVERAQCTTYNYKEFCEKSTDSCTWLGNSCDRFEKNPFPQPGDKKNFTNALV